MNMWKVSNIIARLLAVFFVVVSSQAHSFDGWMNVHLGSSHLQPDYVQDGKLHDYNEKNLGMGLAIPVSPRLDVLSGFYENSYNKTSVYAGVNYHTANNYGFSVGVNSGVVTGYGGTPNTKSNVALMIVPHVTYAVKNFRAEIGIVPSVGVDNRTPVMTFTIGSRF